MKSDNSLDEIINIYWEGAVNLVCWVLNQDHRAHAVQYKKSLKYQRAISLQESYDFWKSVEFVLTNIVDKSNQLGKLYIESFLENAIIFDVGMELEETGNLKVTFMPAKGLIGQMWYGFVFGFMAKNKIQNIGICQYCNQWFHRKKAGNIYCTPSHTKLAYMYRQGLIRKKRVFQRPAFYGEMDIQKYDTVYKMPNNKKSM